VTVEALSMALAVVAVEHLVAGHEAMVVIDPLAAEVAATLVVGTSTMEVGAAKDPYHHGLQDGTQLCCSL
jgi:hypothetical protein